MWQRVYAPDNELVTAAFNVLSTFGSPWASPIEFKWWLETYHDRVFYLSAEPFQLVIGFHSEGGGTWRGTVAGIEGQASLEAIREIVSKSLDFAQERGAVQIVARVRKRSPSDPLTQILQFAVATARGDARVREVNVIDAERHRNYCFVIRQQVT